MGIKGSVRRNMDGHIIHANCDTDVIVWEEPPNGSTEKPTEMYEIIERFCLGKRYASLHSLLLPTPCSTLRPATSTVQFCLPLSLACDYQDVDAVRECD